MKADVNVLPPRTLGEFWKGANLSVIPVSILVLLAIGAIYIIGIESMPAFHDSFHDVRHAAGYPCH